MPVLTTWNRAPMDRAASIPRTLQEHLSLATVAGICSPRAFVANYVQPGFLFCHQSGSKFFVNNIDKHSPLSLTPPDFCSPEGHNLSCCPKLCSPNCSSETVKDKFLFYFRSASSPSTPYPETRSHSPGAEVSFCGGGDPCVFAETEHI